MTNRSLNAFINAVLGFHRSWFDEHGFDEIPVLGIEETKMNELLTSDGEIDMPARFTSMKRAKVIESAKEMGPPEMLEHLEKQEHNCLVVVFLNNGDPTGVGLVPLEKFQVLDLTPIGSA